jgi:hypothetical protein
MTQCNKKASPNKANATPTGSPVNISAERRLLLEFLRSIRNGRIEGLQIRAGEPLLDPAPTIVRDVRLGRPTEPSPDITIESLMALRPVAEMFDFFGKRRYCDVVLLEVKEGVPVRMEVRELPSQIRVPSQLQPQPKANCFMMSWHSDLVRP